MVFKGRFFSSKKSSSPESSNTNSPKSTSSNSSSPIKSSDKKKPNNQPPSFRQIQVKDAPLSPSPIKSPITRSDVSGKIPATSSDSGKVTVSPILASSLGLNRIKTRSGPLPQESFFSFGKDSGNAKVGVSNLSKTKNDEKEDVAVKAWEKTPSVGRSRLQNGESSSEAAGQSKARRYSGNLRSSELCTPEMKTSYDCENPKESESPRFQAILRVTSAPRKRYPTDIKSFSHELNSKGVRPYPFWKPRGLNNLEEVLVTIRAKFDKAKEEVDTDLHLFAADLLGILEKNAESQPDWQETLEDLLVLAQRCAMTTPGEFWLQCEGIVQELDDRRQELPMGILKQLHTRMLFILTRCTRLLQFHKESGLAEDELVLKLRQSLHSADKSIPPSIRRDDVSSASRTSKPASRKYYSQEQRGMQSMDFKKDQAKKPDNIFTPSPIRIGKDLDSPTGRNRMSSWKPLPSPGVKIPKEVAPVKEVSDSRSDASNKNVASRVDLTNVMPPEVSPAKDLNSQSTPPYKHQHKASWGWGDQSNFADESSIICRICEEEVPTLQLEDHSRICAIADRCDQKGLRVDDRLLRISETLEKLMESFTQKDLQQVAGSPDGAKVSNSSVTEESDLLSPKLSDWSRRGSEDMLDCLPDGDMDDMKGVTSSLPYKTRFGPKSDQGMTTSSAGSITPRSPLLTPRTSQIDLLLTGKGSYSEHDDLPQMNELADIARCAGNTPLDDDRSQSYLLECLEDLKVVTERRKFDALTVETFGARIEKLIREKYMQLFELVDDEKIDITSTVIDEDAPLEDDVVRSLRTSPIHSAKDRTSIDDFEIIKPISRGAFGRVFLAKKRTTGDLFAIKVLKKADMIRKNAVESILAERDILISVRNPFVVRFFYSFTCRENLYLVMEYLNGGDLYSLLRNLGCLDEDVARVYIAEVVLALEYLHSLRVVHRDLKPDNLLIAHDGHIKLTDFGLSKVGLINSTDDLSGPAVSGTSLMGEHDESESSLSESQQERRKKRSAVGTPDYLAPEILLGTGHGTSADWWSVGVILFELIVGIPPFNAEHPQTIFDNILNRNIPWPMVPEEMSPEAADLIDKLLTEDPNQRLGARGTTEVKQHPFFRDINWDTLARQKAAFVPSFESALDTSYFTSRYTWNTSEEHGGYPASESEDSSDNGSMSGSSSCPSNRHDEVVDEYGGPDEYGSPSHVNNYSFSNFSFKNLSQLASINYDLLTKGLKDEPTKPNV
uniref:non-specific serine/threonine protein kinase n=1 Tax=Tanacetum cinerariifolium TaxID=118510 RepID=A0A699GS79_TANCI|nr:probable serine/threonine protein kinase IREH1 isoform X1 [Tanacetum cinerariifolium]GEW06956.1 probable serine/threonine protein kinase IREH1 isoform X1 [Tanacetum cinerariifolium]